MTATFSNLDMCDMIKSLDAALDQSRDGKGDPLALIEDVRDSLERARTARAVHVYARQLIEKGAHREDDAVGTSILNHVSYIDVHHPDQRVARDAFNDVRHSGAFGAYLATELAGRMSDHSFGEWEEVGVGGLAASAFGQYMATVVMIELDQRTMWP